MAGAVTLVLGLLVTAFSASIATARHQDDRQAQFDDNAARTQQRVERTVQDYFHRMRDAGAFVSNARYASPERFTQYVADARLLDQRHIDPDCASRNVCGLPSLSGAFFVTRIEEADYEDFIANMRVETPGYSPFLLPPPYDHQPGRPYYLLLYYAAGSVDLKLPLGTDVAPMRSVTDMIDQSNTTGDAIVGSFAQDPFIQELASETQFAMADELIEVDFFFGVPVYASEDASTAIGWVGGTIENFSELLKPEPGQPDDLGLRLTVDLTNTGMDLAATENTEAISQAAEHQGSAGALNVAGFSQTKPFSVEGVDFELTVWSPTEAGELPLVSKIVIAAGTLASFLLAFVVYLRVRSRQQKKAFARELQDREQFQRDMLESVTNAMVVLDRSGRIMGANPAWDRLRTPVAGEPGDTIPHRRRDDPPGDDGTSSSTGRTGDATVTAAGTAAGSTSSATATLEADDTATDGSLHDVGRAYLDVLRPNLRSGVEDLEAALEQVLAGEADAAEVDVAVEEHARHRWYAVRITPLRGTRGGAVVVHTDVTERKRSHDELELKATHDHLTGLLNRQAFEAEVDQAMNQARAQDAHLAVLFIDLDGFKPINDSYGHAAGDDVLRAVAQRISGTVRTSDRVARLGGDEFVVLISPLTDPAIAQVTASRILKAFEAPVEVGDHRIPIAASIGVATLESPLGGSHDTLIELADEAMYVSKQKGGGGYSVA